MIEIIFLIEPKTIPLVYYVIFTGWYYLKRGILVANVV